MMNVAMNDECYNECCNEWWLMQYLKSWKSFSSWKLHLTIRKKWVSFIGGGRTNKLYFELIENWNCEVVLNPAGNDTY